MLGEDPLAPIRVERRKYYLGGFEDGESARAFVSYLQSLISDQAPLKALPARPLVRPDLTKEPLQPVRQ
jgi:hypothetical protein